MHCLRWIYTAIATLIVTLGITACDVSQQTPIAVVVYPGTARCAVLQNDQETPVPCGDVGKHLRDVLKIAANREVDVSFPGSETVAKENNAIDLLAEQLRATGYTKVRSVRFGL